MRTLLPLIAGACVILLASGCPNGVGLDDPSAGIPATDNPVRRMAVWPSQNQALDWDDDAEPDGLHVPVFLWSSDPLPVHRLGTLQCILYQADPQDTAQRIELLRWEYGPQQMRTLVRRNRRDWPFYPLVLDWGGKVPKVGRVLLRVRFIDPQTGPVSSDEIAFTVTRTGPRV